MQECITISIRKFKDSKSNHLTVIKDKKFTRRETDVIACLMCSRPSAIPSILSISSRTVEAHVHNIMLKLECNSREGIIDFVERSGKTSFTQAHYQTLAADILFEKSLKEIEVLTRNQNGAFRVWLNVKELISDGDIAHRLEKHIKIAGVEIAAKRKNDDELVVPNTVAMRTEANPKQYVLTVFAKQRSDSQHADVALESRKEKTNVSENSVFAQLDCLNNHGSLHALRPDEAIHTYELSDYYKGVFSILKTLYPQHDFDKQINDFYTQHDALLRGSISPVNENDTTSQSRLKNRKASSKKNQSLLKLYEILSSKSFYVVLFSAVLFGLLFVFASYKVDNAEREDYRKKYARSDLRTPPESVFLKRPVYMKKIKDFFSNSLIKKPMIRVIGLTGLPGSGKTTLARTYAKTLRNAYVIWEIKAGTRDAIVDSFKNLAYALAQTKKDKSELLHIQRIQSTEEMESRIMAFVAHRLKRCPNWLLIYDNVESFSNLEHFFPHDVEQYGAGKVIITTRNQTGMFSNYLNPDSVIDIDALSMSEILTLFTKMTYNTEVYVFSREKEKRLIQFLSHIPPYPLDVAAASYYIKNTDITCEMYLERMHENSKAFEAAQTAFLKDSGADAKTRYNIITLSAKRLLAKDPEFKDLLLLLSFVASDDIPKVLLESYKDPVLVDRFIVLLKKYALITGTTVSRNGEQNTFSIHRSTQKIMRNFFCEPNKKSDTEDALRRLTDFIQKFSETYVLKKSDLAFNLVSHINMFMKNIDGAIDESDVKAQIKQDLYYALGYAYNRFGRNLVYEKDCFVKAYISQSYTKHIPTEKLAMMLNELGSICVDLSHNDDAIFYAQKSLDLCKTLPNKTLVSADCLRVIGFAYLLKNNFTKASLHFNKSLQVLSSLDANTRRDSEASIYALLGWLYSVTYINGEQAEKGISYVQKAVSILNAEESLYLQQASKGKNEKISCEIARVKTTLADAYCHLGDYKKAYELGFKDVQYIIDHQLDNCSHSLLKVYVAIGMGEIHLREMRLSEAKKTLVEVIKQAEDLVGAYNILLLSPRVFSAETHIRLNELDRAYSDCLAAFKTEQKECPNYSKLIFATAYYHAAIVKYKQGDFVKSLEHFNTFFDHAREVSKLILNAASYNLLEGRAVFAAHQSDRNAIESDVLKLCFKNAEAVFEAIYGNEHPFVKEYVESFA